MALPLYALTLFISAFILFLVQPIIGKILLPKLGGTPQVWNTCMVFFQMVLLAGYAYTHNASTKLTLRQQLLAHVVLLFLPLLMLVPVPFAMAYLGSDPETGRLLYSIREFIPDLGSNPIPSTLAILFTYVALPFVVVSTTAPLLQKWFAHTGHPAAKDPYFLYGASNFGSMLSLILYPLVIEPNFKLGTQTWLYAFGYFGLVVFVLGCAGLVWNSKEVKPKVDSKPEPAPAPPPATAETGVAPGTAAQTPAPATASAVKPGQPPVRAPLKPGTRAPVHAEPSVAMPSDEMTLARRLRWIMLAAVPSSLMLGITTHITTDLSPIPFFWLVPLILYLGSFILVFMRWPFLWTERLHEPGTQTGGMKPHTMMLLAQPFFLVFMIMVDVWNLTSSPAMISVAIFGHGLGFFATTMVCHGELAKDRPATKHLTEFYLWMSVGGMVGGMFNALIAPVIFHKLWELPLAIFAAGLVRPAMFELAFVDNFFGSIFESSADVTARHGPKGPHGRQAQTASDSLVRMLDWVWPLGILVLAGILMIVFSEKIARSRTESSLVVWTLVAFGIPLGLAILGMGRPMRIGLGIGAVLLMYHIHQNRSDQSSIFTSRSYFGTISVKESQAAKVVDGKQVILKYKQLVHGHINHGLNYEVPPIEKNKKTDRGDPDRDFSRLATTYYHREGPVGRVMEKYNWFYKGAPNTYTADARIPASLVGNIAVDLGTGGGLPMTELVTLWSEPPIATVGLGTGTMASYGRPYQHVHFYEIDNQILRLSLVMPTRTITSFDAYDKAKAEIPEHQKSYMFNYLERAMERGSSVQVLMGDARLRMALPYKNHYLTHQRILALENKKAAAKGVLSDDDEKSLGKLRLEKDDGGGPNNFYHMMVVDAFSSDAIPAHLLTEEAFKMYFEKLVPEGVLCVHTSNRFVDLPKVVGAVASTMKWSDYEVKLDAIDANQKTELIKVLEESAGLSAKEAKEAVDGAPKSISDELRFNKAKAESLKLQLQKVGATVSLTEHSHSFVAKTGHDINDSHDQGHYTSEWVMVARKTEYIFQRDEDDFDRRYREAIRAKQRSDPYWTSPSAEKRFIWTDDYYNLMSVVRFR